ncbi:MAG: peptidylprolyl isomerase [bacterium]|jgi:cyclophilin family peptidyl-prolyl cis-trans isomerase/HEAT repeat protein
MLKKIAGAALAVLLIVLVVLVFYYDLLNIREGKIDSLANIVELEDTRFASDRLVGYLNHNDPEIRARAALALGRIGDLSRTDELFKLLGDSSVDVAATAAFAIGITGRKEYAFRLLEETPEASPDILAMAIQSAGRLADSTMTDFPMAVTGFLSHPDHRVREQAAYALWRAGARSASEQLFVIGRSDPVRAVRVAALYALARIGIADQGDFYMQFLPDNDPFVRMTAIRGLGLRKDDSQTTLAAVGLNDRDNSVVSQAISSLTTIGSISALEFLQNKYEGETDEKLKLQLIESFTRLKSDLILDQVSSEIDSLSSPSFKAAAVVYLATIQGGEALALIDSLLELDNRQVNAAICQALQVIGGEYAKPRLGTLLNDSMPEVRRAAFDALCVIDPVNVDYYINTVISDTDATVAAQAIDKIGQLKARQFLPQLKSMMRAQEQLEVDIQRSIAGAAGEFLNPSDVDSLAEEILYHCLLSKDYLVSKEAADNYKKKLNQDRSEYITRPEGLLSKRELKKFIRKYSSNPHALISLSSGEVDMELYPHVAPLTVYNFIQLAREKFYDGLTLHRVVPAFVVQGGDPHGDGWGGPGYYIRCEYSNLPFERGAVGIATSGKDSGGSQFFIMLARAPHLDARYTLFGKVVRGMEHIDKIVKGDIIRSIRIIEVKSK